VTWDDVELVEVPVLGPVRAVAHDALNAMLIGAITGYAWNFGNGSTSASPNPSAIYNTPGVHTVPLTVSDNDGATALRSTTITVNPANQAPVPVISASPLPGASPLVANVNGANSSDPDGSIVSYTWNFGNGQTETGPLAQTTYAQGTYALRLTVVDNRGSSRSTTTTIVAGSTNASPVAVLSAAPTSGPAPLLVQLSRRGPMTPTARSRPTPGTSATARRPTAPRCVGVPTTSVSSATTPPRTRGFRSQSWRSSCRALIRAATDRN